MVEQPLHLLAGPLHDVLVAQLQPTLGRDQRLRLGERLHQQLPLESGQHRERPARLLPEGVVRFGQRAEAPAAGAAEPVPPGLLDERAGNRPAVADDVHEPRLGEHRMQQPRPRPAGELVQEQRPPLRRRAPLEERPQPARQPL